MSVDFAALADQVGRQIPPVWPLASSIAVNPFLGQTHLRLAETSALLRRTANTSATAPRAWYQSQIELGHIHDGDLEAALQACTQTPRPDSVAALRAAIFQPRATIDTIPLISDLASLVSDRDWSDIVAERIGTWAGGYFDQGQALWAAPQPSDSWAAYRAYATHDLTPEILGLSGFSNFLSQAPDQALRYLERAVERLGLSEAQLPVYWHQLLLAMGGWAQLARYQQWQAELNGQTDHTLTDLLCVRLLWEEALYCHYESAIANAWAAAREQLAEPITPQADDIIDEIVQEAAERAAQRRLGQQLAEACVSTDTSTEAPRLQAAFCIDVRSEVYRRALEQVAPDTQTLGFAGFFGLATAHQGFGSDVTELRLPALLPAGLHSQAGSTQDQPADTAKRHTARAKRAWGRFKLAAVSSFAFVEAMGPVYIGRLIREALGLRQHQAPHEPAPQLTPALSAEQAIDSAEQILRAMTLTDGFAPLVLLVGHGANVVNNPHASALHCGACGGHAGDVNARLLASLLNDPSVRKGLAGRGIQIPEATCFIAALHDTTTDQVHLYEQDLNTPVDRKVMTQARQWLGDASLLAQQERSARLPRADSASQIAQRARDWSETRPEWGLAGCQAFIAAPRAVTRATNLQGQAFLHDYQWRADQAAGYPVLELILTAPVVVASWISLQYFGSAVAPETFGAGNKLLHNIVGGVGVVEGNGTLLRAGLPWQSVHDGEQRSHDPLRLTVAIQAPREAIDTILEKHPEVAALFNQRWLHLLVMDDAGQFAWRYNAPSMWTPVAEQPASQRKAAAA